VNFGPTVDADFNEVETQDAAGRQVLSKVRKDPRNKLSPNFASSSGFGSTLSSNFQVEAALETRQQAVFLLARLHAMVTG
jgi:hypothetical protein